MLLWLDDVRPPQGDGWTWVRTVRAAKHELTTGTVTFASLDHDLGGKQDGYDLVLWMIQHDIWPSEGIVIHSWNLERGRDMTAMIDRHGPYTTRCRHIPFRTTDLDYI